MACSLLMRAALLGTLLLPLLSACGPAKNEFAPACPQPTLLPTTSDLIEYRQGSSGRDLNDLVLQGRVMGLTGKCEPGDKKTQLNATVTVGTEVRRGPALQGANVVVPIFVAVTEGDRILDKRVYNLRGQFPSNVDRIGLTTPPIDMVIPISPSKSGAAYAIIAGFQLTPEQLAAVRGGATR